VENAPAFDIEGKDRYACIAPDMGAYERPVCDSGNVPFIRGDVDANSIHELADGFYLLSYLLEGGTKPPCLKAADADDSGKLDLADPLYLFLYHFGGPPPPLPFPACGVDRTPDRLACESFEPCAR